MIVAAIIVAALVVAAVGAVTVAVRRRLPVTRGTLTLVGLRAPATVTRDRVGVAHVDAASMEDAAYAMGVVHAQERLWQLDLTRRVACGRISEIAGADGLTADRFLRRVGLRRIAEVEAELLPGETRAMLEAYAAGINAIIDSTSRLPLEFSLLRTRPERWSPVDSISCAKLLALSLSLNWDSELQRLRLVQEVGPDIASRLALVYPESNPTILAATVGGRPSRHRRQPAGDVPGGGAGGCQAPSVRATRGSWHRGAPARAGPILCNDPHLEPSAALALVRRPRSRGQGLREHRGHLRRAAVPDHRPQPAHRLGVHQLVRRLPGPRHRAVRRPGRQPVSHRGRAGPSRRSCAR